MQLNNAKSLPADAAVHRVLNSKQTAEVANTSERQIRRMVRAGTFPKPIRLTDRKIGWKLSDLLAHFESRRA